MVENYESKTKTPSALVFTELERLFGNDALRKRNKYSNQLFVYMHCYLGREFIIKESIKEIQENFLALNLKEDPIRKGYLFSIKSNDHDYSFSTEEIFAMIFRYVQTFSSKFSQSEIRECSVSVPNFFNYRQRLAIIQAVKIAGMRLVLLVNQNSAAAAKYSLDNSFHKETNIIIYNMGASYTQVSLVALNSFNKSNNKGKISYNSVKILDETWAQNLGGNNFDDLLSLYILKKENLIENNDLELNKLINNQESSFISKFVHKLKPFTVKYKEILSANKEIYMNIPGIKENRDIKGILTRNELNEVSGQLSSRILKPVLDLFKRNEKIKIGDISSIQLIGGATRMPFVKEILKNKFTEKMLGNHINGDDSIALGSAFIAGNFTSGINGITQNYKKVLLLNNGVNYEIYIKITNFENGEFNNIHNIVYCKDSNSTTITENCTRKLSKEKLIFSSKTNLNTIKVVNFRHDSDFVVTLFEKMDYNYNINNSKQVPIMKYKANLSAIINSIKEEEGLINKIPRISLTFKIDELGLITLKSQISYEIFTNLKVHEDEKGSFKSNTSEISFTSVSDIKNEFNNGNTIKNNSLLEKEKSVKKNNKELGSSKVILKTADIEMVEEFYEPFPLNRTEIIKSKVKLNNLDNMDEIRQKLAEARNILEGEIYKRKEWLESDKALKYCKIEELTEIKIELNKIKESYEDNYASMDYEMLADKSYFIESLFRKIDARQNTQFKREDSIKSFRRKISSINIDLKELEKSKKVLKADINNIKTRIEMANNWLKLMENKQEELKLYEVFK